MESVPIDADISGSAFEIWMRFGLSCRGVSGLAKHERQPRGHPQCECHFKAFKVCGGRAPVFAAVDGVAVPLRMRNGLYLSECV